MKETLLREVFTSWLGKELPQLVRRDYEFELADTVTALIGPRRAGKTFFMYQIASDLLSRGYEKSNIAYIDFEDIRLATLEPSDYPAFVKVLHEVFTERKGKIVLFLDEVQSLPGWERWVRTLHNSNKYYIFVSGSSSKLLGREVATQLRGRYVAQVILPFSFKEFLRCRRFKADILSSEDRGRVLGFLDEYLRFGGFPEVVKEESENRKLELLKSYVETVFYRDVVDRFRVRDVASLEVFMKILFQNMGKLLSISKVHNYFRSLGVRKSKKTLSNYLKYFETSLYVFTVEKFGYKTRNRVKQPRKLYPIDTGLYWLHPRFSKDIGILMETRVAIELYRRALQDPMVEVYYWRDYQQHEVDFLVRRGLEVESLIQVTYVRGFDEVDRRELRALVKASDLLKCRELSVITWDYEDTSHCQGRSIKFIPLWKWLLRRGSEPKHKL